MPRIKAGSVAEHRELMLGALLDAFGELLGERGYADLTLAEVAGRAGMARNTVYNYVGHKEALLMAYMGRAVCGFVGEVRAELASLPDAPARLRWLVRRQMHQFTEHRHSAADSGMLDAGTLGPTAHAELMAQLGPLHELVAEIMAAGRAAGHFRLDLDVAATLPLVFAVMATERLPVATGTHDPDEAADRVGAFLVRALS